MQRVLLWLALLAGFPAAPPTPLYTLPIRPASLRQLRASAFDWGASRGNAHSAHLPRLQQLAYLYGIPHAAAEYEGTHGSRIMGPTGRVYQPVLSFFAKHLNFMP